MLQEISPEICWKNKKHMELSNCAHIVFKRRWLFGVKAEGVAEPCFARVLLVSVNYMLRILKVSQM